MKFVRFIQEIIEADKFLRGFAAVMYEKAMPFQRCKFVFGLRPQWRAIPTIGHSPFLFPKHGKAEPHRKILPIQNQKFPMDSPLILVFSSLPASLNQPRKHRLMSYLRRKIIVFLRSILHTHPLQKSRTYYYPHPQNIPASSDRESQILGRRFVLRFAKLVHWFGRNILPG